MKQNFLAILLIAVFALIAFLTTALPVAAAEPTPGVSYALDPSGNIAYVVSDPQHKALSGDVVIASE